MRKQDITVGQLVAVNTNSYQSRSPRWRHVQDMSIVKAEVVAVGINTKRSYSSPQPATRVKLLEDAQPLYGWRQDRGERPAGTEITVSNRMLIEDWETFGPSREQWLVEDAGRKANERAARNRQTGLQDKMVTLFNRVQYNGEPVAAPDLRVRGDEIFCQLNEAQITTLLCELGI